MNVYFISGLSANCKVFDRIDLPEGYKKIYIEWHIPQGDESLEEYSLEMAKSINRSKPFILVGYSLGGIVIQEMNKFLSPNKNIIISSIKAEDEIPPLFRLGRMINFAEHFPMHIFADHNYIIELFARMVYRARPEETMQILTYIDPIYMKWSISQILSWIPTIQCENLYHIHGTEDHIFPYKYIKDAYPIERGDHMMVMKKYKRINKILATILDK